MADSLRDVWSWDSVHPHYIVDYAKSGRSKCKEFRCGKNIESGELRVGIGCDETDHAGNNLGWYHPECLWKTFSYKKNANKKIKNTKDIKVGFSDLEDEDKDTIRALISGKGKEKKRVVGEKADRSDDEEDDDDATKNGSGKSKKGGKTESTPPEVTLKKNNGLVEVSGNTFNIKDEIKSAGCKWLAPSKCWAAPEDRCGKLFVLLKILNGEADNDAAKKIITEQISEAGVLSTTLIKK